MGVIFKPTTEDSNYDVNKDAEHVVGPVNATEAPSPGMLNKFDQEKNKDWWEQRNKKL